MFITTAATPARARESQPNLQNEYVVHAAPVLSTEVIVSIDQSPPNSKQAQQGFSGVAYNSTDNQFMVIWTDRRNDDSTMDPWEDPDIYGHRINSSGTLIGATNTDISDFDDDQVQDNPGLAYNPDRNEFLAVWRKYNGKSSNPDLVVDIQAALVDAVGSAGTAQDISDIISSTKYHPAVVYSPGCNNKEYFVVWAVDKSTSPDNSAENYDIYARRVLSNTGAATGSEITVTVAISSQLYPVLAYNSITPGYFVVWQSFQNGKFDIYGQRLDCNGAVQDSVITISSANSNQVHPSVAYNSNRDEYLVLWEDYRNGNADIYAQRVQADGTLVGSNFAVSDVAKHQSFPKVVYDSQTTNNANDQYVVVWEDLRNGNNYQIYGRQIAGDGSLVGTSSFTIAQVTRNQRNPNLAYNSVDDTFLVTWADETSPGDATLDTDIYSRLFTLVEDIPKLSISKSGPALAITGDYITYTLTIINLGTVSATNLVITDTIPAGATYVNGGTRVGNVVSWTIDSLAAANGVTQTTFVVTATSTITNDDYRVIATGGYSATGSQVIVTTINNDNYSTYLPVILK
ncbi:MAG: DUF11 domain-containing protein [Planctomycetes bacterium]|nr:DUF11 domain-containing protein [Planctomycetota bacterium]